MVDSDGLDGLQIVYSEYGLNFTTGLAGPCKLLT
jgi:hypothetical protein